MHLRHRRGAERLVVELSKDVVECLPVVQQLLQGGSPEITRGYGWWYSLPAVQLLLHHRPHERVRHRVDQVSQARQPVRVLAREEVLSGVGRGWVGSRVGVTSGSGLGPGKSCCAEEPWRGRVVVSQAAPKRLASLIASEVSRKCLGSVERGAPAASR